MDNDKKRRFDALLDLHLDRLDDAERDELQQTLHEDPELRAASDRLRRVIQPLDHLSPAPAPEHLADRVMAHIGRAAGRSDTLPFPAAETEPVSHRNATELTSAGLAPQNMGARRLIPLREVIAVAACIALLVGVFVPGISSLRSGSQRAMCMDNLGSIYRGTTAYQASFGGSLPFAGRVPGASWLPAQQPGTPYASNSRHVYLLVKLDYGPTTDDFFCPCDRGSRAPDAPSVRGCNDFTRACSGGYASLNLSGRAPKFRSMRAIPYIADANPLFVNAKFDPTVDANRTNSRAHGGQGQNLLTLDGTVQWMTTPQYQNGARSDNVWLIRNVREYTGMEAPTSPDDVQLLQGYPTAQ